jgi:hypothetical protein
MLQAKIIPQSACIRLEAYEDCIEYFVCLNGHLLGICTLAPLSDSEDAIPSEDNNHTEKKQDNGFPRENVLKRRNSLLGGSENGPPPQKRLTNPNQ